MRGMTGFGEAKIPTADGGSITVQVRSENARQLAIKTSLPEMLASSVPAVEASIRAAVHRGSVRVAADVTPPSVAPSRIDEKILAQYAREARKAARAAGADPAVSMDILLGLPGVVVPRRQRPPKKELIAALEKALVALEKHRRREGRSLRADLRRQYRAVLANMTTVRKGLKGYQKERRTRVAASKRRRADRRGAKLSREDLGQILASDANKGDVNEEITRLREHLEHFNEILPSRSTEEGLFGKRLDFIAQEMHREVNTLGDKTEGSFSREVVAMKAAIDRIRELAANVE